MVSHRLFTWLNVENSKNKHQNSETRLVSVPRLQILLNPVHLGPVGKAIPILRSRNVVVYFSFLSLT